MRWRRIIDSTAFALAVGVAAWTRYGLETSWYAALGCALLVFLLVPFVVSRMLARYLFRRLERVQQQLYVNPARQTPRSRTENSS
jgi:hypothetical protein